MSGEVVFILKSSVTNDIITALIIKTVATKI